MIKPYIRIKTNIMQHLKSYQRARTHFQIRQKHYLKRIFFLFMGNIMVTLQVYNLENANDEIQREPNRNKNGVLGWSLFLTKQTFTSSFFFLSKVLRIAYSSFLSLSNCQPCSLWYQTPYPKLSFYLLKNRPLFSSFIPF